MVKAHTHTTFMEGKMEERQNVKKEHTHTHNLVEGKKWKAKG